MFLKSSGLMVLLNYILTDFVPDLSVHTDQGVLKSPAIKVNLSMFPYSFITFFFIYFDILLVNAYTLWIVMSS